MINKINLVPPRIPFDIDKVEAIRTLDVQKMRNLLNISSTSRIILNTNKNFRKFISNISFEDFTDLRGDFPCLLIPWNDASIYSSLHGKQLYVSNNGNTYTPFNIVGFISKLANCTLIEAENFIKDVYRIFIHENGEVNLYKINYTGGKQICQIQSVCTWVIIPKKSWNLTSNCVATAPKQQTLICIFLKRQNGTNLKI